MARKTIKGLEEIISDLEKRLDEQYKINIELHNKIAEMQEVEDDKFEHSPMSVSYTHLDVYKRQVQCIVIWIKKLNSLELL